MTQKRAHTVLFVLTLLVVAASYAPVLTAPFVAEDYVIYSPAFLSQPLRYFHQDLWGQVGMGETFLRPLAVLTFAGDNLLRGEGAFVPHLTNLLLHLALTTLVGWMILFCGTGGDPSRRWLGAVAGMLLFGLHPQAIEAVAWVSGRWEVVAALFGTLGLCSWIRLDGASGATATAWRFAGLLCFAAALLSKETAAVYVAAAFLWGLGGLIRKRSASQARLDWKSPASLVVLSIVYLSWRYAVLGHIGIGGCYSEPIVFSWRLLLAQVLALAWPFAGTGAVPLVPLFVVVVGAGVMLAWSVRRQAGRERTTGLPWGLPVAVVVLNLGLFSMVVESISTFHHVDVMKGVDARFSYPGLIMLSVLVGWLFTQFGSRPRRWTAAALAFVIVSAFVWPQQYRIFCWKTASQRADSLISQTVALAPDPEKGSMFFFKGLPVIVKSMGYAYFFGLGLPEAVALRYHRSDLTVDRWPTREIMEHPPDNAYIFSYDFSKDELRLLHKPGAGHTR